MGFPKFLGNDFVLVGYRVFVKYVNTDGKRLRGLYILKSETNKKRMEFAGNCFTHYKYSTTDISWANNNHVLNIHSRQSGFTVNVCANAEKEVELPRTSPFSDWKQARRFAGPLPFTFSFLPATHKVIVIEGVRQNWTPKPIEVLSCDFSFLNNMQLQNIELANAFIIENVPYHWKKGKVEKWAGV